MLKGLFKDSVVYGIANAIQKLVPFFIVPVIIHQLGQTALKLYDISFVYAYLFSWLVILGQDSAASVFYFDETKTFFNKKQVLGYGLLLQGCFLFCVLLAFIPFKSSIAGALFSADQAIAGYWLKALLVIPGHMLLNYALNILLWQKRKKEYVALCICQTIFSLVSVYAAIAWLNGGLTALFYCLIGTTTLCGLLGFLLVKKTMRLKLLPLNKPLLKKMLWFGLPFAFTSFLHQALPSVDRYFLLHYGQQEGLPQYILAAKLGSLAGVVISAFALAFTPYSMTKLNEADAPKQMSSLFHFVAVVAFMLVPLALLFKDLLIGFFADASFTLSGKLLPFFFFGWVFDLFSYFSMLGIYKAQNSLLMLVLLVIGIVLLSGLNMLLIPRLGVYGAAVAFCVSKAALFFIPLVYLRRHFHLSVHAASFVTAGGLAAFCSYLLYTVEWYSYCAVLLIVLGGTAWYLTRRPLTRMLFYNN